MLSNTTIEDLCKKLRPILGEQIEKLYMKYSLSTEKEDRLEIERLIHALYHKHLGKSLLTDEIMLEPPLENQIFADYPLGNIIYADKELYSFGMREKDWIRHLCVSGMSGSGKTTFAYTILGNMIYKNKPFLVFDWKRSFRPIFNVSKDCLLFTIGNENLSNFFKTNINIPPKGVGPKQWITIIADLLSESYNTSFGVHKIITEVLDESFTDFKVYEGSQKYPNWHQIKERLQEKEKELEERKSSREYEWVTSALRIVHSLTFGSFGEVINYNGNDKIEISHLNNKQIIFELDSLSSSEKKFFTSFILTYIFKNKKADSNNLCNEFKQLILVDEAHNIFLKDRPNFLEEPITEVIFREIREYGVGLVCLDQHVSKLSHVVCGNSACNIAFQQQLPDDINSIASLMQLEISKGVNQRKYLTMLPVGYAIVKLAERYNNPFLIKVPFIDTKKSKINDDELEEKMETRISKVINLILEEHNKKINSIKSENKSPNQSQNRNSKMISEYSAKKIVTDNYEKRKEEYIKKRKPIRNHIQKELIIFIRSLIDKGFDVKNIRRILIQNNYSVTDVNTAISNIEYRRYLKSEDNSITKKESYSHIIKELNKIEIEFLKKIGNNNFATTKVYQDLQLSSRKGNELKNSLLHLGLIEIIEDKSNRCITKRLCLSKRGFDLLENAGIPII
jgi:hypothetical protein